MMLVQIKGIKKSYSINGKEKYHVLHGIDLSFNRGEFVSILGESGCGKSTLMNIIGGMDSHYQGEVLVEGENIKNSKESKLDDYRKSRVGFIFQSFNLIPHLTALENVTIAMQMVSESEKERNRRAREILAEVGLKDHMMKRPNQLSGGQKQRVAIARALANDPDIILADEPTGALDKKTSEQILELLNEIAQKGKLIIAVTHSKKVADFGTRIVTIEDGRIIEDKNIKERYRSEEKSTQIKSKSLSFFAAFRLALKNMKLNIRRNVLVSLGASIGILSVVMMLSLGSGTKSYINNEINSSVNPLLIEVNKQGDNEEDKFEPAAAMRQAEPFTQREVESIRSIDHVSKVEEVSSLMMKGSVVVGDKQADLTTLSTITSTIKEDSLLEGSLPEEDEILISSSAAEILTDNEELGSLVGDQVTLYIKETDKNNKPIVVEKEVTISGILDKSGVGPMSNMTSGYVQNNTLGKLYSQEGLSLRPTQIQAYAENEEYVDEIKTTLSEDGYSGSRSEEMIGQVMSYLDIATAVLSGIAGISLVVSGIMILVVLYISVVERTREIGILRAIGARKQDVKRIFFSESALIGFFSGLIGVIGAALLGVIGNGILSKGFGVQLIDVNTQFMLYGVAVSVLVSVVAGLMPAAKAAKLDPIESLRYE